MGMSLRRIYIPKLQLGKRWLKKMPMPNSRFRILKFPQTIAKGNILVRTPTLSKKKLRGIQKLGPCNTRTPTIDEGVASLRAVANKTWRFLCVPI